MGRKLMQRRERHFESSIFPGYTTFRPIHRIRMFAFYCPACNTHHEISTDSIWRWNGSLDAPSFSEPLLINDYMTNSGKKCHMMITDGRLNYYPESTHELAGKSADMIDVERPMYSTVHLLDKGEDR